jgi:hypothetical protein
MTVSTLNSTTSSTANGTNRIFYFDFALLEESHLEVYTVDTANSGTTTLQSAYQLDNGWGDNGGSITFNLDEQPANGITVFMQRDIPVTQETDYIPGDPFPAETHEDALDKLTMLLQQLYGLFDRCIIVPIGDTATDLELPFATARANKYLVFDSDGNVDIATATAAGSIYSTTETDTLFNTHSTSSDHDGRYYTETEINALLAGLTDYYNVVGDWNKQQYFGTATISGAWNLDDGQVAEWTLGASNTASNPTNMKAGGSYMLFIRQDATGSRTITWGDAYVWEADAAPSLSTSALETTIVVFISDGSYMYGTMQFKESG